MRMAYSLSAIYERILAAQTGILDVTQQYWEATARPDRLIQEASAFEE